MIQKFGDKLGISGEYTRAASTGYAAMAANILAQIALVPLYLSYLGKAEFGTLMIIIAAINYSTIGVTWLASGTTRIIGELVATEKSDEVYHAYLTAKIVNVGYAIVIGTGALCLSLFLDADGQFSTLIPWAVLYLVVLFDFSTDRLALTAARHQGASNSIAILNTGVAFAATLAVLMNEGRTEHIFGAMVCGVLVARLACWWYWRQSGLFRHASFPDRVTIKRFLARLLSRMGAGYAIYGFILLTLLQVDPLVLNWLGGPELVASYILVWKAADVSIQLIWRLPEYLQPKVIHLDAQGKFDELRSLYTSSLKTVLGVSLLAGVLYAAFGQHVVTLWVGEEHAPTDSLAYMLAGGAIFWMAGSRVPIVFAHARVRLKKLISVMTIELSGKLVLTIALFSMFQEFSPLAAINAVYVFGVFPAYLWIIGKDAIRVGA